MIERFTKAEAKEVADAVDDMFKAIPKTRRMEYLGHLNDILLFIEAAGRAAPDGEEKQAST